MHPSDSYTVLEAEPRETLFLDIVGSVGVYCGLKKEATRIRRSRNSTQRTVARAQRPPDGFLVGVPLLCLLIQQTREANSQRAWRPLCYFSLRGQVSTISTLNLQFHFFDLTQGHRVIVLTPNAAALKIVLLSPLHADATTGMPPEI